MLWYLSEAGVPISMTAPHLKVPVYAGDPVPSFANRGKMALFGRCFRLY